VTTVWDCATHCGASPLEANLAPVFVNASAKRSKIGEPTTCAIWFLFDELCSLAQLRKIGGEDDQ